MESPRHPRSTQYLFVLVTPLPCAPVLNGSLCPLHPSLPGLTSKFLREKSEWTLWPTQELGLWHHQWGTRAFRNLTDCHVERKVCSVWPSRGRNRATGRCFWEPPLKAEFWSIAPCTIASQRLDVHLSRVFYRKFLSSFTYSFTKCLFSGYCGLDILPSTWENGEQAKIPILKMFTC